MCGGELDVTANYLLLHENFADVTHVPIVHPEISPQVLHVAAPPLEIELTEASVWYSRNYPAAPLAAWQSSSTGLPDGEYEQRESGHVPQPRAVGRRVGGVRARPPRPASGAATASASRRRSRP